jgi:Family of unknown function (DUF5678)
MSNIYIEQGDDGYVAYQNKNVIATGETQKEAARRAHNKRPCDPVLAERIRNTDMGSRDNKWRRMYP